MNALTALADDFYDYAMSESPLTLMWAGKLIHLDSWDDFTQAGDHARQAAYTAFLERANAIDPGEDRMAIALRDNIAAVAQAGIYSQQWRTELVHVNPRMGAFEMVLSFIDNFPLSSAEHGEAYLTKLRGMPAALDQIAGAATDGADRGIVALARHLTATADSVAAYLATPAGPEERLAAQKAPAGIGQAAQDAWQAERDRILADDVRPALERYEQALRELAKRGRPDDKPGLTHLPGGDEAYQRMMWAHLLIEKDPHEVHQIGLDQIAALEDEYRAIAGPLLGTQDIAEIYAKLRDDQSMKYTDPAVLVADAEEALARATAAAAQWFGTMPTSRCEVEATDFGPMAYYSTPDLETGKPGKFYFNTSHPEAWSTYELEAIVYHEGIPGHHLHLALGVENEAVHKVQKELHNTAFAEGWGLYTERLSDEMGLYSSDLTRLGMLSADSLRACRLVVDTGMHALGWTRDQAIDYMVEHSPMDRTHVEPEVDRYIGMPGQALAYMIGRLEIEDIRREAEKRPGFDIRQFHDKLLGYGHVPLSTARAQVLRA